MKTKELKDVNVFQTKMPKTDARIEEEEDNFTKGRASLKITSKRVIIYKQ